MAEGARDIVDLTEDSDEEEQQARKRPRFNDGGSSSCSAANAPGVPLGTSKFPNDTSSSVAAAREMQRSQPGVKPLFRLLRTHGLAKQHNEGCISLAMLASGNVQMAFLCNMQVDFDFLVATCPWFLNPAVKVKIAYQFWYQEGDTPQKNSERFMRYIPRLDQYGSAHGKMGLLKYKDGLRVFITTANFGYGDWELKTQGVWWQDFPLKRQSNDPAASQRSPDPVPSGVIAAGIDPGIDFVTTLKDYLRRLQAGREWVDLIDDFDFSGARAVLVTSVPFRSSEGTLHRYAQLKMAKLLRACPAPTIGGAPRVLLQFSSLAKTSEEWLNTLVSNFNCCAGPPNPRPEVELIFPTEENVRNSREGWLGGGSAPCSLENVIRKDANYRPGGGPLPLMEHLARTLCPWPGEPRYGRGRVIPHMKSYMRYRTRPRRSETGGACSGGAAAAAAGAVAAAAARAAATAAAAAAAAAANARGGGLEVVAVDFYCLTSSNLSRAAWGELEKRGSQLYMKSYEIGVLFLPPLMALEPPPPFCCTPNEEIARMPLTYSFGQGQAAALEERGLPLEALPLPYPLLPPRYEEGDRVWIWNIPQDKLDVLGNKKNEQGMIVSAV